MDIRIITMRIAGLVGNVIDYPVDEPDLDVKRMVVEFEVPYELHYTKLKSKPIMDLCYADRQADVNHIQNVISKALKNGEDVAKYAMEIATGATDVKKFVIKINIPYTNEHGRVFVTDWDETVFQEILSTEFDKKA